MYGTLYNIDYKIFCFGNVYGPRDDPKFGRVTSLFINNIKNNKTPTIFGDGAQTRDFIYVKDIAKFITNSMFVKTDAKLFHLANGEQISVNDLYELIKKHTNTKIEPTHSPAINGEVHDMKLDTSLVRKELNWKPLTSFDDGLKETIDYFLCKKD